MIRYLRLGAAVILILTTHGVSSAHDKDPDAGPRENSLRDGSWSLQFQIDEDFVLREFNGSSISVKWHTSRHSAWRVGVGARLDFSDTDQNSTNTTRDPLTSARADDVYSNEQFLELNFQYLRYPRPDADINIFMGVGPVVAFSRDHDELVSFFERPADSVTARTDETRDFLSWSVGMSGLLGVEWFAKKSISIHAEYNYAVRFVWSSRETTRVSGSTISVFDSDTKRWDYVSGAVRFGLSAYF